MATIETLCVLVVLIASVSPVRSADESCLAEADVPVGHTVMNDKLFTDKTGGPVEAPEDIEFDASKDSSGTCWQNYGSDLTNYKFIMFKDSAKLQDNCNKASPAPASGPVLAHIAVKDREGPTAMRSCSIICAKEPPKVTVEGTQSGSAKLEVCLADSFENVDTLEYRSCKPVEFGKPVAVGDGKIIISEIVIKADGFELNDFVAIKSIKTEFDPCPRQPQLCAAACNFTKDTCGYKPDTKLSKASNGIQFKNYPKETAVGNADTGVNALLMSPSSQYPEVLDTEFLAAPLNPSDFVVSSVEFSELAEDTKLSFKAYDSCKDSQAKVCADDLSKCQFMTNLHVDNEDRQWVEGTATIPKGTKKLLLVADNSKSAYYCAAGFASIDVPSKDDPKKSACLS